MRSQLWSILVVGTLVSTACQQDAQAPAIAAPESAPAVAAISLTFEQIALADDFTCGIVSDHHVYCWGSNHFGQLGDGTLVDHITPAPIADHRSFRSVDPG